jgi:predicted O-methyltransferase YrrM
LTRDISPASARIPWIPFECLDYLKTLLRPEFRVFEYGSGGSTFFFAARTRNVVSVEHNPEWYEQVSRIIRRENLTHCDYHFLPPTERNEKPSPGLPAFVNYTADGYPDLTFLDYVRAIDVFPDGHFDLVSVDGRARNSCLFHAKPKVKPGGYLLLDNAEREEYSEGKKWMDDWSKTEFDGPGPWGEAFWQAIIWRRPR